MFQIALDKAQQAFVIIVGFYRWDSLYQSHVRPVTMSQSVTK